MMILKRHGNQIDARGPLSTCAHMVFYLHFIITLVVNYELRPVSKKSEFLTGAEGLILV